MQTFGWNLLQFARSVDNLHQENIDAIKELVTNYFLDQKGLGACYFCVHRGGSKLDNRELLKTVWSSNTESDTTFVSRFADDEGTESPSLRALAYNERRCLWVTAKNGAQEEEGPTLDSVKRSDLVDYWPEHQREDEQVLAPYVSLHDKPCRTMIALPLTHVGTILGVLAIEFDRQIPCTPDAKREAELIRRALARILWLEDAAQAMVEGTRKALDELKDAVMHSISSVDPPRMFFAFPGQSDAAVIMAIKEVLASDYGHRLKLVAWDAMNEPGQITDQIVQEISRCRYGVCYLSQKVGTPDDPEALRFIDNSNVLIEAGMLDVLVHNRSAPTAAWIPVREADHLTEQKPFDFVAERTLEVPRDADGALKRDEFEAVLRSRLDAMLGG